MLWGSGPVRHGERTAMGFRIHSTVNMVCADGNFDRGVVPGAAILVSILQALQMAPACCFGAGGGRPGTFLFMQILQAFQRTSRGSVLGALGTQRRAVLHCVF